jgi:hypothetical protein
LNEIVLLVGAILSMALFGGIVLIVGVIFVVFYRSIGDLALWPLRGLDPPPWPLGRLITLLGGAGAVVMGLVLLIAGLVEHE